ncbi:MAG: ArsI/CadI family heavy metal resistance metalloenzyme [Salibacteraceae bacterium]
MLLKEETMTPYNSASEVAFPRMHISLYVSNLIETVNFYTAFFGKPAEKVKTGYAKYVLESPALVISFIENPERVQSNFGHLGFQVETPEILEQFRAQAAGLRLITKEETGTACCFAVQDKFWVTDPDGVQWEVYYFHANAEFNDPHYTEASAAACCLPPEPAQKPKVKLSDLSDGATSCTPGSGCC